MSVPGEQTRAIARGSVPRTPRSATLTTLVVMTASLTALGAAGSLARSWLVGASPRPDLAFDVGVPAATYLLAALTAAVGTWWRARRDVSWWLVTVAAALRAAGFLITGTAVAGDRRLPYPSVADAALVLADLVLVSAIVLRRTARAREAWTIVLLDGLAAACVLGGAFEAVVAHTLEGGGAAGVPRSTPFDLVYPVLDLVVLVTAVTVVVVGRWRPAPATAVLLGAAGTFAVLDLSIYVAIQRGTFHPGDLRTALTLAAFSVVAGAVLFGHGDVEAGLARARGQDVAAPAPRAGVAPFVLLTAVSLVTLIVAGSLDASPFALTLLAAATGISIGRGVLSYLWEQLEALARLREANAQIHRFQALVEASTDLIGLADAEGRVAYLNPAGRQMLHIDPAADLTGLSIGDLTASEAAEPFAARWRRLLDEGAMTGERIAVPGDGSPPVPVAVSAFVVHDEQSDLPFAVGTIQRDITERLRVDRELRRLVQERESLLNRLMEAQEAERARIAGAVHDEPLQALAAANMRLELLRHHLAPPDELGRSPASGTVSDLQDIISLSMGQLRDLLFDLEPPVETGLRRAVERAADFVFADTPVHWRVDGDLTRPLTGAELMAAYRICKEALFNARKHADAGEVVVEIRDTADGVSVVVGDDGRGFDPEAATDRPGHRGLSDMRDRAAVVGGAVVVSPRRPSGTRVQLTLPAGR